MKTFNVKQSGSEVILEEMNPFKKRYREPWKLFTPLILTSIDPNIKIGELIREDQLEPNQWQYKDCNGKWINCVFESEMYDYVRQVAKLKQPVHETQESDHVHGTRTEKEEKVTGEETELDELKTKVINLNTHSRQVFANWIINNSKSF